MAARHGHGAEGSVARVTSCYGCCARLKRAFCRLVAADFAYEPARGWEGRWCGSVAGRFWCRRMRMREPSMAGRLWRHGRGRSARSRRRLQAPAGWPSKPGLRRRSIRVMKAALSSAWRRGGGHGGCSSAPCLLHETRWSASVPTASTACWPSVPCSSSRHPLIVIWLCCLEVRPQSNDFAGANMTKRQ
jgi:hypothetical protein